MADIPNGIAGNCCLQRRMALILGGYHHHVHVAVLRQCRVPLPFPAEIKSTVDEVKTLEQSREFRVRITLGLAVLRFTPINPVHFPEDWTCQS